MQMVAGNTDSALSRTETSFVTVVVLKDEDGACRVVLACISPFASIIEGSLLLCALENFHDSTIYYKGRTYFQYPRLLVVHTSMEYVHDAGGWTLSSPSWEDLMSMPLPISQGGVHGLGDGRRTYIGGTEDIYPPLHRGVGYSRWYMGVRYFSVASHVHHAHGIRVEFWSGSYVAYFRPDGLTRMAEVLHCMVDSRDGRLVAVCRQFLTSEDITQANIQIPNFIHCSSNGRRILQQEVFYTTNSVLCELSNVIGKSFGS